MRAPESDEGTAPQWSTETRKKTHWKSKKSFALLTSPLSHPGTVHLCERVLQAMSFWGEKVPASPPVDLCQPVDVHENLTASITLSGEKLETFDDLEEDKNEGSLSVGVGWGGGLSWTHSNSWIWDRGTVQASLPSFPVVFLPGGLRTAKQTSCGLKAPSFQRETGKAAWPFLT